LVVIQIAKDIRKIVRWDGEGATRELARGVRHHGRIKRLPLASDALDDALQRGAGLRARGRGDPGQAAAEQGQRLATAQARRT
jgi:hypothetical protein